MTLRRPAVLLTCLAAACGPAPSGTDGGAGACDGPARTPANLVHNGTFECGGAAPAEWAAIYGTWSGSADAHGGTRAAQVTASGAGGRLASADAVYTNASSTPQTLCATAWMRTTAPNMRLVVMVDTGGGGVERAFASPREATWVRLPPSTALDATVPPGARVYLRFETKDQAVGDTLIVDDVDLWASPDGRCSEVR